MLSKNVKRLPDAYSKHENSNNNKMLLLQELALDDLITDMKQVEEALDIYKAHGKTLDLYGDIYGQKRGGLNDAKYRYMILARISSNSVQADASSITSSIVQMFNASGNLTAEDIVIEEADEPCTVKVVKLPLDALIAAGFTSRQAVELIKMVMPVGISVVAENFDGTFEFSATADEYNEDAGFADDEQTIGGYFGLLYGEDDETVLPV